MTYALPDDRTSRFSSEQIQQRQQHAPTTTTIVAVARCGETTWRLSFASSVRSTSIRSSVMIWWNVQIIFIDHWFIRAGECCYFWVSRLGRRMSYQTAVAANIVYNVYLANLCFIGSCCMISAVPLFHFMTATSTTFYIIHYYFKHRKFLFDVATWQTNAVCVLLWL